jgi:hypothetical protein
MFTFDGALATFDPTTYGGANGSSFTPVIGFR